MISAKTFVKVTAVVAVAAAGVVASQRSKATGDRVAQPQGDVCCCGPDCECVSCDCDGDSCTDCQCVSYGGAGGCECYDADEAAPANEAQCCSEADRACCAEGGCCGGAADTDEAA